MAVGVIKIMPIYRRGGGRRRNVEYGEVWRGTATVEMLPKHDAGQRGKRRLPPANEKA